MITWIIRYSPTPLKFASPWGKGRDNFPPAIIVKFIYFQDKNNIYNRQNMLAIVSNRERGNGRTIYIREQIEKADKEISLCGTRCGNWDTKRNYWIENLHCFIREIFERFQRLAKADKEINERTDSYNIVTTTWKSQVKVFAKSEKGGICEQSNRWYSNYG